jgi:hypothetical protein
MPNGKILTPITETNSNCFEKLTPAGIEPLPLRVLYEFNEMIRLGLAAGNDLLMICHRTENAELAFKILEKLPLRLTRERLCQSGNLQSKNGSTDDLHSRELSVP